MSVFQGRMTSVEATALCLASVPFRHAGHRPKGLVCAPSSSSLRWIKSGQSCYQNSDEIDTPKFLNEGQGSRLIAYWCVIAEARCCEGRKAKVEKMSELARFTKLK